MININSKASKADRWEWLPSLLGLLKHSINQRASRRCPAELAAHRCQPVTLRAAFSHRTRAPRRLMMPSSVLSW
jgi:hypothetical protein